MTQANQQKLYSAMTVDEQLRYVTDLSTFIEQKLPRLERIGDAWEAADRKDMETGLALLAAFQFARDFVDKSLRYGDYSSRVRRIRVYIDKIKQEIAKGLAITGSDGHTYALVRPTVPQRRRGRPSREEMALRRQGLEVPRPTDKGMEAQIKIAQLVGLDVRVAADAPREKNNAELAVIRQQRQAEYDRQNPSLFAQPVAATAPSGSLQSEASQRPSAAAGETTTPSAPVPAASPAGAAVTVPDSLAGGNAAPPSTPALIAAGSAPEYRLNIFQKAPYLSDELKPRAANIKALRTTAAAAAERAKLLAEQGADPDTVAPYATEAQESVEAYETIYRQIDEELGTLYYRLLNDEPYKEKWLKRFSYRTADDIHPDLLHDLRLHYKKVQSPDFDLRCRTLIEQESPEYMAKVKAEEARKEEIQGILRYLKRTDKPNALTRRNTARERFARLQQLLGQQEAEYYRPYLTKIEEDYDQNFRPADEAKAEAAAKEKKAKATVPSDSVAGKKKSAKKPTSKKK